VKAMAKFRHVHVSFWQDAKVLEEMTPEDKYFYIYLLTNPNTTQIGIYQITKKQMAFELGYSIESINSLVDRFENAHKVIKYNLQTREMALLNWGKYNLVKGGKPVLDCIEKELREVKDASLIGLVAERIPNESIKNLFLRYVNDTSKDTLDDTYHVTYNDTLTTSTTISGEKEKQKEKEKIVVVVNPFSFYQENFGVISPFISDSIQNWINDVGEEIVIEAMKRALKQHKKWNYAEGILQDWVRNNVRTLSDIEAYEAEWKRKRKGKAKIQGDLKVKAGPDIPREFVYDIHAGEDWP
jgi:DnaD/phage-associated family protein